MKFTLTNEFHDGFSDGKVRLTIDTDLELALEILNYATEIHKDQPDTMLETLKQSLGLGPKYDDTLHAWLPGST